MLKIIRTVNNTQNTSERAMDDYYKQLVPILESIGFTEVRKGGRNYNGSSSLIDLNNQAATAAENIEWVRDVVTDGSIYGRTPSSSTNNKINHYIFFKYEKIKFLLCFGQESSSVDYSNNFTSIYVDSREHDVSLIPNNRKMFRFGYSLASDIYNGTPEFPMEHTIFKDEITKTIQFTGSGVGKNGSFSFGITNFNEKYSIVHPAEKLIFCDKVSGTMNPVTIATAKAFTPILAGSSEIDKVNGVMPTGDVFLGLDGVGILCKANNMISLPYNYSVTQNLIIGDKIYHKVPLLDCAYTEAK